MYNQNNKYDFPRGGIITIGLSLIDLVVERKKSKLTSVWIHLTFENKTFIPAKFEHQKF